MTALGIVAIEGQMTLNGIQTADLSAEVDDNGLRLKLTRFVGKMGGDQNLDATVTLTREQAERLRRALVRE